MTRAAQQSLILLLSRQVSLGGGPGYELLAYDWFARYWAAVGATGTPEEKQRWLVDMHSTLAGGKGEVSASAWPPHSLDRTHKS